MRKISLFLALLFVFLTCTYGCQPSKKTDFVKNGTVWTLSRGDMTITLDASSGFVTGVKNSYDEIEFTALFIDQGVDGKSVWNQMGYLDMSGASTWELPTLYPRMKEYPDYTVDEIVATDEGFNIALTTGTTHVLYRYVILDTALKLDAVLSTDSEEALTVNGVSFIAKGIRGFNLEEATFEFPGSTPSGKIDYSANRKYKATTSDYSCPAVVIEDSSKVSDILFVDEVEKWTTGSYYDEDNNPCVAFLAAVEGTISKDSPMEIGSLYIPMVSSETGAYRTVQEFWTYLGYKCPDKNELTSNLVALYSGHPYGTMDTDYNTKLTLAEYAETIDSISKMGFDAIWLLPVFSHTSDNVYEPIDQGIIDRRYGGIEEAKTFIDTAHSLGMSVLFDFVPHGPRPVYPFAKEHDDWISKDKDGNNQIEWDCISFDYNNEEYLKYTEELVEYYASTIGLDGARIDCSMGGLSNWYSPSGLRASASGLQAGRAIVSAMYKAFTSVDPNTIILPENFHPSPAYASVTDVFYDMPLYRCIYNLNQKNLTSAEYVSELTQYLKAEHATSVAGQLKLRFLDNHDTVSWTFDSARPQSVYGVEKAKAMWMIMGWIDGVMFIYQGDEDPETYGLKGENLEEFFTEVISAKRELLPNTMDIEYLDSGSSVFAFRRYDDTTSRTVLVNLSGESVTYPLDGTYEILTNIGGAAMNSGSITLEAYAGVILNR